jgi:hypothetical protein
MVPTTQSLNVSDGVQDGYPFILTQALERRMYWGQFGVQGPGGVFDAVAARTVARRTWWWLPAGRSTSGTLKPVYLNGTYYGDRISSPSVVCLHADRRRQHEQA